jgi:hypothetical protein
VNTALAWQDDAETAKVWFEKLRESGAASRRSRRGHGQDFAELCEDLGRNLLEGWLSILTAVFRSRVN